MDTPTPPLLDCQALAAAGCPPATFTLAAGECLPLMGPSGCGKSRLLRALADLDPHAGDCRLDGLAQRQVPATDWRRRVMLVPAESAWWEERVGAHFPDPAWLAAEAPTLALAADCADWPVARLSTGERQRLALLRALAHHPRVLLLDEPTSGLDAALRLQVEALLARWLRGDGRAALVVTHEAEQARRLNPRRCLRLYDAGWQEDKP